MSTKLTNETDFSKTIRQAASMLTKEDKQEIAALIEDAIGLYGSSSNVANRCGCSPATISQMISGQYTTKGDDMWRKVAAKLGWSPTDWKVDQSVTNTRIIQTVLRDAQANSLFIAISERAGAGKTAATVDYVHNDRTKNVFRIVCRKWSTREFLIAIRVALALPLIRGTVSVNDMLDQIIHYFQHRKGRPLLIIDQANSLQPTCLSLLIYIYNELEDRIGCVISGTENLQQKIERGVKNKHEGYDELEDRFGRTYVHLLGYLRDDVKKICSINGINDPELQKQIWQECAPVQKMVQEAGQMREVKVIESGRVIKRKIMKYNLLLKMQNNNHSLAKSA